MNIMIIIMLKKSGKNRHNQYSVTQSGFSVTNMKPYNRNSEDLSKHSISNIAIDLFSYLFSFVRSFQTKCEMKQCTSSTLTFTGNYTFWLDSQSPK